MANHSIVSGTLRITSTTPENALAVCKAIETIAAGWYFSLEYTDDPRYEQTYVIVPFTAEGRWSFTTNMEYFADWLQSSDLNTVAKEEAFTTLVQNEFTLEFSYQEEEPMMGFIGDGFTKMQHKAGTALTDITHLDHRYADYPYDIQHLVDICGYDKEYANHVINGD